MEELVGLCGMPVELLDKVVGWVAVSSVKEEDASLVALASVCKTCREVVLCWLMKAKASGVFQEGTSLSPLVAGFLVHKPNVLKQFSTPLVVEGELIGQNWEELLVERNPLQDRWRWTLRQATREVWPAGQTSLHMLRCYCVFEECECLKVESNCEERPTGLRCEPSFSLRAGYEEEVLREILEEEKAAVLRSGASRRWEMLYKRLHGELQRQASHT